MMKTMIKTALATSVAGLLGACAGQRMHVAANEVQQASCVAATQTLQGRPDHDVAYRACVDAKARQQVD